MVHIFLTRGLRNKEKVIMNWILLRNIKKEKKKEVGDRIDLERMIDRFSN